MLRGNVVMKGYFKDKAATEKAMAGGWFHSGRFSSNSSRWIH
jgi:fatty-acyl-CoA synthase